MTILSSVNGNATCQCDHCGKEFQRFHSMAKKYKTHYCDNSCAVAKKTAGTFTRECEVCGEKFKVKQNNKDSHRYCSHKCRGKSDQKRIEVPCMWCGNIVEKIPAHIKKTTFCSCSCRAKHHIRLRQGFRRSYGEKFLTDLIQKDFPSLTLLENKKNLLPSGLEIDIFVEDKNLAIELNGPCHYFNIYGEETLLNVQSRDAIKQTEIQKKGYQFIVLNISTSSDRKKLEKFLETQYQDNIKPLL